MPWSRERSGHLSFDLNQNLAGSQSVVTAFISVADFSLNRSCAKIADCERARKRDEGAYLFIRSVKFPF